MEWVRSLIPEGKLYGMIALIAGIVWAAGYSARVDQRWHQSEWLPAIEHDPGQMLAELETGYFDADGGFPARD